MTQSRLQFGILGFGIFGEKRLIPAFKHSKFTELLAITKRDLPIAAQKAQQYQISQFFASKQELLKNPEIDAVFIASPNACHLSDVIDAANAGKHILLEKPMGITAAECEKMIEICNQKQVKFMVAHCMRYNSTVNYMKQCIINGEIGKLQSINCKYLFTAKGYGRKWMFDQKLAGGGPVIDIGVHCIDLIRFLGEAQIKHVHAINHIPEGSEIELSSDIHCELTNGIIGHVYCSFESPFRTELEIIGDRGSLRADNFNKIEEKISIRVQKENNISIEEIENKNCYAAELDAFAEAVLFNKPIPIPGNEGLENQRVIDQILSYRSF